MNDMDKICLKTDHFIFNIKSKKRCVLSQFWKC